MTQLTRAQNLGYWQRRPCAARAVGDRTRAGGQFKSSTKNRHKRAAELPLEDKKGLSKPTLDQVEVLLCYPPIDMSFPGLELLHAEPPVFLVHDFLTAKECDALRDSALQGQLVEVQYGDAVLLDHRRLALLPLVVLAGTLPSLYQALAEGRAPQDVFAAVAAAGGCWAAIVAALVLGIQWAMQHAIQGKVFTGIKWSTGAVAEGRSVAGRACRRFLEQAGRLLCAPTGRFEQPTVTRYLAGQYQRMHTDARPDGDPQGLQDFLAAGGQRLAQCIVYLNSLAEAQGGGTHFHHSLLKGLTVHPMQGAALVFFTAFRDGRIDPRMTHSGLPVQSGEKWILGTWECQRWVRSNDDSQWTA